MHHDRTRTTAARAQLCRAITACLAVGAPIALCACSLQPGSGEPGGGTNQRAAALGAPAYCEGLDADNCLLPWPSSRFLVRDRATATGYRVALPPAGMPENSVGAAGDPAPWNRWDGFSPMTSAMAELPVRIDPTPLVDFRHVDQSLGCRSPTILYDATARRRVAHWAEIEAGLDADPARTTLYVRPAARLAEGHHFVVAVRRLRAKDGSLYAGGPAFVALRDRQDSGDPAIEARRARFEADVLRPLDEAGVERRDLALAWDFRTGSGRSAWGDLLAMRDDAVRLAGRRGLGCAIDSVIDFQDDPHLFRRVDGHITVPTYLGLDGRIARDRKGRPERTGTAEVAFTANIPASAAAARGPTRLVLFGHGLLQDRFEIDRDFFVEEIDRDRMIAVATNLTGLAVGDDLLVAGSFFDANVFPYLVDQVAQSVVATLLLPRTVAGLCSDLPAFRRDGRPLVDGAERYYIGESQGGIFAPTFAALADDMDRFVMGVGGVDYSVLTPRSVDFPQLAPVFALGYPRGVDRQLVMVMSQHEWERIEGSAFAPHVLRDRLVGGRPHLLAHIGLDDVGTGNEGSYIAARTLDLPQAARDAAPVWGLDRYHGTSDDALVTFDYGVQPVPPSTAPPPMDNGVHERPRRDPRAQRQIDAFLRPRGVVTDVCGGPCN